MTSDTPDFTERCRALDPEHSFIVQAPAGSGKTGLLIQRYLTLLTCADEPEEVVAITFTRKAAAEMRERIVAALVKHGITPDSQSDETGHEKLTRALVDAVLRRDKHIGWHIIENPTRLRIQTFDSLCASLTRQMPVLSEFGAQPETIENASDLYLEAARATIGLINRDDAIAQDVQHLLEHLDNDVARIEKLLADMLERRDHWLRHIHGKDRDELEAALKNTRREALKRVCNLCGALSPPTQTELIELVRYAATNLVGNTGEPSVAAYASLEKLSALPTDAEQDAALWHAIAEMLLTREKRGAWRKQYTIREGFPSGSGKAGKDTAKSWKDRMRALVSVLTAHDDGLLCRALYDIRENLPSPVYTDKQWKVLGSILRLLPRAVGQLKLVFQSHKKVDFTEVAQGALRALGDPEMPTDLALALDYRIRHLLIDEFQDTSISQYELVTKLTAGWEPGDGRSMLLVGDPMQSIYRFREAEVGLFLRARVAGIGNVALQPISLSANFRSQRGIVAWVNDTFARVMPRQENIAIGAVAYMQSVATHDLLAGAAVSIHPFFNNDHATEAEKVLEIVTHTRRDDPSATMAILVRNRSHLQDIVPCLKKAGIRFRAIEVEGLGRRPVVQDLLALTRALAHPADRLAWLALLRAPWCGLTLADIHTLVAAHAAPIPGNPDNTAVVAEVRANVSADTRTIWELLNNHAHLAKISPDGSKRLLHVRKALKACMENRCRQSLRMAVETAWQALGGPGCIDDATDLEDGNIYLDYLEAQEEAGGILNLAVLEEELTKLYALPDMEADDSLQIMTIHKAKGLEFDCVIVPGLGRSSRSNDKKLFLWMENPRVSLSENQDEDTDMLLAPIQEAGADPDRIYFWLEKLDNEKACFEDERLLYVAATRARARLHLLGSIALASKSGSEFELRPAEKTLLNKIWPVVESVYVEAAARMLASGVLPGTHGNVKDGVEIRPIDQSLRRLVSGWVLPAPPPSVQWNAQPPAAPGPSSIEYSWVGETARHIGNIVHRWLQRMAEEGVENWSMTRIQALGNAFRHQLAACGMNYNDSNTDAAVRRVIMALTHAVSDARGQWLLGPQQDVRNELRMSAVMGGEYVTLVIDRTFCDEKGQRWVVDYKTSSHEGADIEGFLNREQERYRFQLDRYAAAMQLIDSRPVRRGLYFPLLKGWREWGDEGEGHP